MGSGSGASTTAQHTHTRTHEAGQHGSPGRSSPGNGKLCMALWDPSGGERAAPPCLPWHIPESHPCSSTAASRRLRGDGGKGGKRGRYHQWKTQNQRSVELFRLEKVFKIIKSNRQPPCSPLAMSPGATSKFKELFQD